MTPTPKEKAQELVDKMYESDSSIFMTLKAAKACAILAVDGIMKEIGRVGGYDYDFSDESGLSKTKEERIEYYQEVKEELLKM